MLNVKAQSTFLSLMLMIAVTVALAAVAQYWAYSYISQGESASSSALESDALKATESFVIDDVRFYESAGKHLDIYVRNTGSISLTIDRVYINETIIEISPVGIAKGEVGCITVDFDYSPSTTYLIKVASKRGNTAEGSFSS